MTTNPPPHLETENTKQSEPYIPKIDVLAFRDVADSNVDDKKMDYMKSALFRLRFFDGIKQKYEEMKILIVLNCGKFGWRCEFLVYAMF
jgi:hypothetical protein